MTAHRIGALSATHLRFDGDKYGASSAQVPVVGEPMKSRPYEDRSLTTSLVTAVILRMYPGTSGA
jgi:hypothetical protein